MCLDSCRMKKWFSVFLTVAVLCIRPVFFSRAEAITASPCAATSLNTTSKAELEEERDKELLEDIKFSDIKQRHSTIILINMGISFFAVCIINAVQHRKKKKQEEVPYSFDNEDEEQKSSSKLSNTVIVGALIIFAIMIYTLIFGGITGITQKPGTHYDFQAQVKDENIFFYLQLFTVNISGLASIAQKQTTKRIFSIAIVLSVVFFAVYYTIRFVL